MKLNIGILTLILFCHILSVEAQNSTFEKMQIIFDAKCTIGCHSGDNPAAKLDLTGSLDDVYSRLINTEPVNLFAKEQGYKLVAPGFADKSFLFRKCNNDLYHTSKLAEQEGQVMPIGQPALSEVDIEIMRQWIQEGAPKEGIVDNETTFREYYEVGGLPRMEKPAAPTAEEGFQIYFGTLFLAPGEEIEIIKKVKLELDERVEVDRMQLFMDENSHHLIISKFDAEESKQYADELQTIGSVIDQFQHITTSEFVAISQTDSLDLVLPEKTAFIWDPGTDLTVNYHVKNYSQSGIFPGEVYLNIHTQNVGIAEREMKSILHSHGDFNPNILNIENTGRDTTITMVKHFDRVWDIWILQGHTHQLGVDYDMFLRNEDGTKGEQIYEGYNDFDHEFNQGFFDYEHPPVLKFEPMLNIDMNKGLIYEATYNNSGDKPVGFGLTTDDEMFITYLLYTEAVKVSIDEPVDLSKEISIDAFPNPFKNQTIIQYTLNETTAIELSLYNVMGQKIHQLQSGVLPPNNYRLKFNKDEYNLKTGMYLLKLITENGIVEKKILLYN